MNEAFIAEARRATADPRRTDSDYVFHELTRSICPHCRKVIDAKMIRILIPHGRGDFGVW